MGVTSSPCLSEQASAAERRLAALRASGLLGAPAEERFDRLTRLACHVLRVPAALVSLLDADRQFFLSARGLPEPWAGLRQTPLAYSFCRAVVEAGQPLAVADARGDPRLRGSPAVAELGVVAYLAVPLALPGGCDVGALCGIDRRPRAWADEDEAALRDLAGAVETEMAAGLRLREAEEAGATLRASEARYRALFEVSPQMVWFADAEGLCTHVNRHYTDFVGLPAERAMGEGWLAAVHPKDRARVRAAWAGAVAGGTGYETEYRLRRGSDASHRWHLFRGAPLRGPDGRVERWIGVGMDVDDRRRAEAALRELIEALGVAVYTTDAAGRLTFYNEAAVALWGWRPPLGDARWCGSWRLHRPDGTPLPHDECPMAVALREDRPVRGEEAVAERPDGTRVPFAAYPTPLRDGAGGLAGGVNVLVDIGRRVRAERALAESEARLRLALEAGRHAFWELDVATGLVVRAPFHDGIFGYGDPLPEWSYEAFLEHVLPEDRGAVEHAYRSVVEGEHGASVECRIRRVDDGAVRWLELHGRAQRDATGRVVRLHGVLRDVTGRKGAEAALRASEVRLRELQSELLHVSRLSAAGEMAAALAHELNQPLTAATSALRAAGRMLAASPAEGLGGPAAEVREAMDLAAEQALRAGRIVRRLRDFVARGEADARPENLARLVEEAGALALVGARERGVAVALRLRPGLPPVLVDRIQVQQVLFNLMRNAVEAMAGGAPPRCRELVVSAAPAGPGAVEVAVADTGPGLAPEVAGRLFEPFVSTKPDGMGMGLSICRTIVEAHGGRLWAEANPGGGTVFRFTLPAAPPEATAS